MHIPGVIAPAQNWMAIRMKTFRVLDLRSPKNLSVQQSVQAHTAEAAAAAILGVDVVRGSSKYAQPVARVYWQDTAAVTNMVRLYARLGG